MLRKIHIVGISFVNLPRQDRYFNDHLSHESLDFTSAIWLKCIAYGDSYPLKTI